MKRKMLKNMEWGILICSIILLLIGMVALFSATNDTGYEELKKQATWAGISLIIMIIIVLIDYDFIVKASPILYGIFIIALIAVLFTKPINGARSWFQITETISFQPSEFAKIITIIFLSSIIVKLQGRDKREINKIWKLAIVFLIMSIPMGLILIQPDLGTVTAFLVALCFILFASGIDKKYIILAFMIVLISVPLLYFFILPEHAKTRIDVFLNPELDPRGSGYNITQSKLAIGSGQLFGMGILKGNQTQLGFLYPKTTDFIFSVIGEEMGFIVTASVVICYVILITKSIFIAKTARDDVGSYIAVGIAGIFTFHMVENIGMTIGLLPITGVPLPFVSYGGSSLITNFACIGLLLNISSRRQKSLFID